jgi:hypothetical protein
VTQPRHQNLAVLKNINKPKTILKVINGAMETGKPGLKYVGLMDNLPLTANIF